jgi:protein-tyrosine-phosphatase
MAEPAGVRPRSVLFLCGHNVVRSPMAAALAKQFFGQSLRVAEAGIREGDPDAFVAVVMDEIGLDLSRHKPRTVDDVAEDDGLDFDLLVSLSPEAHHRAIELTRDHPFEVEYWPVPDPTVAWGNREQRLDAYRRVRDDILARIRERFGSKPAGAG